MLKIFLLGILHITGIFARIAEIHVLQQNGNVVHLLLSGALQSDAVIIFQMHPGVRLLILHSPVYELGGRWRERRQTRESGSSGVMASLQPSPWVSALSWSRRRLWLEVLPPSCFPSGIDNCLSNLNFVCFRPNPCFFIEVSLGCSTALSAFFIKAFYNDSCKYHTHFPLSLPHPLLTCVPCPSQFWPSIKTWINPAALSITTL